MTEPLDPIDGRKWELGHDAAVEDAVEHREQGSERKADCKHGLHLDHRQVPVAVLELFFVLNCIRHSATFKLCFCQVFSWNALFQIVLSSM